ncbi:MAG TPA: PilZ domain-containing protein [Terriglobales bacterium]|nr:PilZ domain-containing protein [Terriglobales bacterium]
MSIELLAEGARLAARGVGKERRKWQRLPLAIPVFVRGKNQEGKEFLEFSTALNISAGGALVAVRRSLNPSSSISLEIPSAPLASTAGLPRAARTLRARMVRITHSEGYHLLGLKFSKPLVGTLVRRKVASPM